LSLVFSRRKPFQGGIIMAKPQRTPLAPKEYLSLVEDSDFLIKYRVDSGDLIRVEYDLASRFRISGLPGNSGWSSRKKSGAMVSYNKMVRGNMDFQEAFLEALRAMGSKGGKPKLVEKIPNPFLELAQKALAIYEGETK
jgi:hypothetical protein